MATVEIESEVCPGCKRTDVFEVEDADLAAWKAGEFIQVAFPYLDVHAREQLKTGYCRGCWDDLMPPEE